MRRLEGGKLYPDTPIGILCLDSQFPKPRGHVRHPRTYPFPTVQYVIRGIDVQKMLFHPEPAMLEPFIEAARELERQGVLAIAGSCGFMARFQAEIAAAVRVPVLLSSLLQLPLIRLMHGAGARIGILTASASALTEAHFANCLTAPDSVLVRGMDDRPEFASAILRAEKDWFDLDLLQEEIVSAARTFCESDRLDALLLECTDLSAFAPQVQQAVGLPVYDINTLVEFAAAAVLRREYHACR